MISAAPRLRIRSLLTLATLLTLLTLGTTACQVLTYHSATGERFMRSSVGANTAIASLTVQSATNGVRAITARFDKETNRTLARTVNSTDEFEADVTEVRLYCFPLEAVTKSELKSETAGWVE